MIRREIDPEICVDNVVRDYSDSKKYVKLKLTFKNKTYKNISVLNPGPNFTGGSHVEVTILDAGRRMWW